jgi:hypothetical protein
LGALPYFKEKVLPLRRAMDARADLGEKPLKIYKKVLSKIFLYFIC